jgi:hypothetical protein
VLTLRVGGGGYKAGEKGLCGLKSCGLLAAFPLDDYRARVLLVETGLSALI